MTVADCAGSSSRRGLRVFVRRIGTPGVDAVLRATGIAGLVAIPIIVLVPSASAFVPLVLSTLWLRGPISGFIPVGLEPLLMAYGASYPAWLVTLIAAGASAYAEFVSMHVVRGVVDLPRLASMSNRLQGSRVMRLFERRPLLAIALTAVSPIPDYITRSLAAVSRFPIGRYVAADTIGRLPKLFVPAAIGATLHIPASWLIGTVVGSLALGALLAFGKWRHMRSRAVIAEPLS